MFRIKKGAIIVCICIILGLMATGYAAFSTKLTITGSGNITSSWDIEITGITSTATGSAYNIESPTYSATTAKFYVGLVNKGDYMTYQITIKNSGTIKGALSNLNVSNSGIDAITYTVSGLDQGNTIAAGETKTLTIVAKYRTDAGTLDITQRAKRLKVELTWIQST